MQREATRRHTLSDMHPARMYNAHCEAETVEPPRCGTVVMVLGRDYWGCLGRDYWSCLGRDYWGCLERDYWSCLVRPDDISTKT